MTANMFDLAWAAGCVDGEGSIRISKFAHKGTMQPQYGLYLSVVNTDPRMPERFAQLFGGSVIVYGQGRIRYEWRVFSSKAAAVLKAIRPFMIVKGEQADIGLAFARTLDRNGGHLPVLRDQREQMRILISDLKHITADDSESFKNRLAVLQKEVG